jgi:IMP dehydrogenase
MAELFREGLMGLTVAEIFEARFRGRNITFGQLLGANQFSEFTPQDICLQTFLTREIRLENPLISSPMDTVTGARMAIGLADIGCLGVIHNNFDSAQQKREVGKVKFGLVVDPYVLSPDRRLEDLELVRSRYSHVPITQDGRPNGRLTGMITDSFRLRPHHETVRDCLADETVESPLSLTKADILYDNGVVMREKALSAMESAGATALAVVEDDGRLFGLVIASDLRVSGSSSTNATLDALKRRRVGGAITIFPEDYERRVPRLIESGVDVLCIDTAHGHSKFVEQAMRWVKDNYPQVNIIAGNVSTADAGRFLAWLGVDAIRVGNGPGGACSTHEVTHMGASSAVGVYRVASALKGSGVKIIADGGITNAGDIFIALALGADAVMCGRYLAPLMESSAPLRSTVVDGKTVLRKEFRGMASASAQSERVVARYGADQVRMPEGEVVYLEPERRPLAEFVALTMAGVRQAFVYAGVRSIPELHHRVDRGEITFDVQL